VLEARKFLKGDVQKPLNVLNHRMRAAAERLQFEYAAQLRDRAWRLDEARHELIAARSSIESLTFLYRVPGWNGEDRIYVIKRGTIKAELAAPRSAAEGEQLRLAATRLLTKRDWRTTVSPDEVNEVLLVARWFRIRPQELENVVRSP
jgi:excinuclease ABC subunit C